jgi:DNA-binding NarL/FixJ family response regulator
MPTTVVIVDDYAGFRTVARAVLEGDGFEVVGQAHDAASALAEIERLRPELVLLDVRLPGTGGLELAELLAAQEDPPVIVLVSSREAAEYGGRLRQTPARGFIPKRELSGKRVTALLEGSNGD